MDTLIFIIIMVGLALICGDTESTDDPQDDYVIDDDPLYYGDEYLLREGD